MHHADKLEVLPVASLVPYARNARTHSPEQVAAVARSIQRFGFTNPVLVDAEGGIVAGHGRVLAAQSLGLGYVPCLRVGWLTEAEKRAYVLADNKLAELAGWDDDLLAGELRALQADDFDLSLTGFAQDELDDLLIDKTEGKTDPDAVPPAPTIPVTRPGDAWVLGRHRIMCGDSTDAGSVALLMNGEKSDLCFTSPPYNLGKSVALRNGARSGVNSAYNEFSDNSGWKPLMIAFISQALSVSQILCVNVQLLAGNKVDLLDLLGYFNNKTIDLAVWVKSNPQPAMADGVMTSAFEFLWFLSNEENPTRRITTATFSRGSFSNVFEHATASGHDASVHGAVFPVNVAVHYIENCSKPNNSIYEPFSGTGTTIIAAEKTGRRCYAMELSPQYVDVAVRRWQDFTGQRAVREADGLEFPA